LIFSTKNPEHNSPGLIMKTFFSFLVNQNRYSATWAKYYVMLLDFDDKYGSVLNCVQQNLLLTLNITKNYKDRYDFYI